MANKNWTLKEAWAANKSALLENPQRKYCDPTLPFSQWIALHDLDRLEIQYKYGNQFALMQAIRECARCDLVMPRWVGKAYIKAFDTILNYESKDWNEVLGNPLPKGANLNALRKKRRLKFAVHNEAIDILQQNPERAIDAWLFEEIGEKFKIGKTQAEKYCREVEKQGFILLKDARPKKHKNPMKL